MIPALALGGGTLALIVFLLLAAFVVIGWYSLRRNVRGIDFTGEQHTSPASPDERR